jgi:hypothetical protein
MTPMPGGKNCRAIDFREQALIFRNLLGVLRKVREPAKSL